jgi:hypothetical protein
VTYKIVCVLCGEDAEEEKYVGHTSQNAYTRGKKHLDELDGRLASSKMWQHTIRKHDGVIPDFQMSVTGVYGEDCMLRQVAEGVKINKAGLATLMNDRSEWGLNRVPQLTVDAS